MASNRLVKSAVFLLEVVTGAVLLAGAVVAIAGFIPVSHPRITQKTAALLSRSGIDSCSIGSMQTAFWKSTAMHRVSIVIHPDSSTRFELVADKVSIRANIPSLLWTKKYGDEFRIASLLRRIFAPGANRAKDNTLREVARYLSFIMQGSVQGATVSVNRNGAEIVQVFEGAIELPVKDPEEQERRLVITSTMIKLFGEVFEKGNVAVSLTPENNLRAEQCTARYFDGIVSAALIYDPEKKRIATASFTVENLDLTYWYSIHAKVGKISGIADLTFSGHDMPLRWPLSRSQLACTIRKCRLSELPVQQSLATSLFIPTLSSLQFEKVTIDAVVDTTDTVTTKIAGTGSQLDFSAHGWVGFSGAINQKLEGTFSAKTAATFPPVVNKTLEVAKNGGRTFRCRLFGTFSDPRFELDKEMLRRAVGNMFEDFRQELMQRYQVR